MIRLIALKDFLLNLTSARFILGFLICLFIIPFTLVVSLDRYKGQQNIYRVNHEKADNEFKSFYVFSKIRPEVVRKPETLSIFSEGITENLGSSVKINFGDNPLFFSGQSNTTSNPLLNAFFSIDFSTVIAIIMSLLALVFSYDCFTRERENGTMKMVFVNRISRTSFFIGKLCGILLTLLPILFFCYLLSILFILLSPDVMLNSGEWVSVLLLFLSSVLYVIVFVLMGMFISSMVKQSSTSITVSLLVWIWFLFLMPSIASYSAQSFVKTDLYDNVNYLISDYEKEYWNEYREQAREIYQKLDLQGGNSYWTQSGTADGGIEYYGASKDTYRYHAGLSPWQFDKILEYADKKWALQKDYYDKLIRQEKVQQNLALLSPSEIFIQLSSSLCHTDSHSHIIYMNKVREYRNDFIHYFKTNKLAESPKWYTPVDYDDHMEPEIIQKIFNEYWETDDQDAFEEQFMSKGFNRSGYTPIDVTGFPVFRYKPELSGNTLNYALYRIALLLIIAIALVMATMLRFRKYHV